jgi:hypothetical protein
MYRNWLQCIAITNEQLRSFLCNAENMIFLSGLQQTKQWLYMKGIGNNGKLRHGPVDMLCDEHTWSAEHHDAGLALIPEVLVAINVVKRSHQHIDLRFGIGILKRDR